jgi:hypothetical protein
LFNGIPLYSIAINYQSYRLFILLFLFIYLIAPSYLMNFHQILLLIVIITCLGLLWLWIKQGLDTYPLIASPSSIQGAKVIPTAPVQAPSTLSNDSWTHIASANVIYKPGEWTQPLSLPKEPTLLEKAHQFAYQHGITSIATIDWFKPQEPLSRESAARMFTQYGKVIHGEKYFRNLNTSWSCEFIDKEQITRWFYRDVIEACYMWYMEGVEWFFAPRSRLNHAQAATIIARITWKQISTWSQLPLTRWWLIEMMLDQYVLIKSSTP